MKQLSSGKLWGTIGLVSLISTLLLVFGFGYAVKDMLWPAAAQNYSGETETAEIPADETLSSSSEIRITAIGDSLTKGTGDATGEGYVKQVAALLKDKWNKPVSINNNLAVNGLRADGLAELLAGNKGYTFALRQANLILFTIGGNDLFQLATGQSASKATGQVDLAKLKERLPEGLERLKLVIARIRQINPNAQIVYVGLYNPFYDMKDLREGSRYIQLWNQQAYELLHQYPNATIVPTFDLFEKTIGDYLSSDHFHPNHEGYAQIAARIVQSLK